MVLQEAFGVTEHIEDVCQRLADAGWLAVAPHLYHRTGDPILPYDDFSQVMPHAAELNPEGILADVDAALAFIEGAGFPDRHGGGRRVLHGRQRSPSPPRSSARSGRR